MSGKVEEQAKEEDMRNWLTHICLEKDVKMEEGRQALTLINGQYRGIVCHVQ